jgi:REP element-mobilizing transposase RayT
MNRGRRGERIFSKSSDYESFIEILKEAVTLWDVRISAYCLMTNHYHLLIQTPQGNISRCMRHINGVYTQRYNRSRKFDGQLFRGRYKSILVDQDNYLLELVRYIHRNPLRAGMVDNFSDYAWSSHHGYVSRAKKWDWIHRDFVLSMLSANKRKDKQAYLNFMAKDDSEEILELFEKKKLPLILGSENFISWAQETFSNKKNHHQIPESSELAPALRVIMKAVCKYYNIEEEEILQARRGTLNEPRNVAIYLCRMLRRDNLLMVGESFNMAGYSSASSTIERVRKKLIVDKEFRKHIDQIKRNIFRKKGQT